MILSQKVPENNDFFVDLAKKSGERLKRTRSGGNGQNALKIGMFFDLRM